MGYRTNAVPVPPANPYVSVATAPVAQDPQYELFRKAICHADEHATDVLLTTYRGLVSAWIHHHPGRMQVGESDDHWVCRTFERFWAATRPERWSQFPDRAALLVYLKLCAHSVLMDEVRRARYAVGTELWQAVSRGQVSDSPPA